jgi:molecular chaperone GrpE
MTDPKTSPPNAAEQPDTDGAEQQAAAVLEDLEALRNRLQTTEQERDQYLALLQRTRADFENYQKRVHRDLDQERRYAHRSLVLDLLPVLDNLERAIASARQSGPGEALLQGVAMVQSQFQDALRRHGITRIEAQGQPFDPHVHEAVMQQPAADVPPGTVVQVLEQGFQVHDQVLRPARVVVSVPEKS